MRLNINLASQPYRDVRRFVLRWTLAIALVGVITIGAAYAALGAIFSWRSGNYQKNELQAQIAQREQVRSQAQAFLNLPANRSTRDESQFVNMLIARKAFSWTEVLTDLERLMPTGLHVVNIRPAINDRNQLELHLVVGGSRERAIDLVRRLEESAHFRDAAMVNESFEKAKEGPKLLFEIVSLYIPSYERRQVTQPAAPAQQTAPIQPSGAAESVAKAQMGGPR